MAPSQVYSPPTFEDNLSFPSENPPASSSQIDPEEQERQTKRDLENRERQQKLLAKDEKERVQKDLKRQQARTEIKK